MTHSLADKRVIGAVPWAHLKRRNMEKIIIALMVFLLAIILLWLLLEGSFWPRKSTTDFWHLSELPWGKKIEGYFYATRTVWYLKPAAWPWFMPYFAKNESGDTYHAKVLTRQDASRLLSLKQPISLTELEHIIPYTIACDIILQEPLPSIAVMDCPCRLQQKNPCTPVDVCLVVGEPFASFIVEHQSTRARRIGVQEALDIIAAEEKRGHIHTAWFKDVMHNRFYAICNCCSCCCLGMKSFFRGVNRMAHSGYSPLIDYEDCTGCGNCASICPFGAIRLNDDLPELDGAQCMGCGLCVSHCPGEAITLSLAPQRGTPLNIEKMLH